VIYIDSHVFVVSVNHSACDDVLGIHARPVSLCIVLTATSPQHSPLSLMSPQHW